MVDFSNDNIVHVKKNGCEYLQFKRLLEYKNKLQHCFTLKPLDYKEKGKNDINYTTLCNALGLNQNNIVIPVQTHCNVVGIVNQDSVSTDFEGVDGLVTNVKNKVTSLVYADCTALLMYDPVKNVVANVHSGWRGTVQKIGEIAVKMMIREFGSNPSDIICCICPTIRQCHFQVEEDVRDAFMKSYNDESIIEQSGIMNGKQKYNIDAVTANINLLKNCGLKQENIVDSGICTVCNSDYFHSYRAQREKTGRNTAIMSLI